MKKFIQVWSLLGLLCAGGIASAGITLTPGALLVQRRGSADIYQLDPTTGATVGQVTPIGDPFSIASSFLVVNNELFVTEGPFNAGTIFRIDPTTGVRYGSSYAIPRPGAGFTRHGTNLEMTAGTRKFGVFNPADWSQVSGPVDMNYIDLPAPYNQAAYFGALWNGTGYTSLFEQGLEPGSTRLIGFDAHGQPLASPVVATFTRPANTVAFSYDIDEFSGDVWLHFNNTNAVGQTNYIARYNPANPGPLNFIALPYDINSIRVVPIPAPGVACVTAVGAMFASRRRRM
jgi:hypothetical protein